MSKESNYRKQAVVISNCLLEIENAEELRDAFDALETQFDEQLDDETRAVFGNIRDIMDRVLELKENRLKTTMQIARREPLE